MKFMLCRNPLRLLFCCLSLPLSIPFLFHVKTKYIGFSILLWCATFGISARKIIRLRKSFIQAYINDKSTLIFKDAIQQLLLHTSKKDEVIIVSGASRWMVNAIFAQTSLPKVTFICSEETYFFGGIICKFHCYSSRKVRRVKEAFELNDYDAVIGYSDSSVDIPILNICDTRYIVNPTPSCFKKFTRSFKKSMVVVAWA